MDNHGQLTVVGLLMIFLTIMVLSILMPTILDATEVMSGNLTTAELPAESAIVKLIPLFIIVTLLSTIALYGAPQIGG